MKLYPPIYPGDNILQPGTFPGSGIAATGEMALSRAAFVRSTIATEKAPEPGMDIAAIEAQARAARAAWVGSKLKSFYQALVRKFESGAEADLEHYLAASQSLADLEGRIHRFERTGSQCC
jgi:hypothetical protein